jgi:hypothetical protein
MDCPKANKARSRGISRDMSPEAIARRIDIVSRLRAFTQLLGEAERIEPQKNEADPESQDSPE